MKIILHKLNRDKQVNIRVGGEEHAIINYAARLKNTNRTDLIIKKIVYKIHNIILEQNIFVLNDIDYQSFIKQLEAPTQNIKGRQRLMNVKPEWK